MPCRDISTRRAQRDEKVPVEQNCAKELLLPLGEGFVPETSRRLRTEWQSRAREGRVQGSDKFLQSTFLWHTAPKKWSQLQAGRRR